MMFTEIGAIGKLRLDDKATAIAGWTILIVDLERSEISSIPNLHGPFMAAVRRTVGRAGVRCKVRRQQASDESRVVLQVRIKFVGFNTDQWLQDLAFYLSQVLVEHEARWFKRTPTPPLSSTPSRRLREIRYRFF
jgi:hypothetical protein